MYCRLIRLLGGWGEGSLTKRRKLIVQACTPFPRELLNQISGEHRLVSMFIMRHFVVFFFFWRQVAAVSNHGDYVSRRLMTFHSGEPHTKDKSYVHMVSGQIAGVMMSSSQVNALNTTGYHWISENGARANSYVGACTISEFVTVNTHTLSFNFLFSFSKSVLKPKCLCIIRDILESRFAVVNAETVNPLPFFFSRQSLDHRYK